LKTTLLALAVFGSVLCTNAADFARWSAFESVDAFVGAAKAFQPAKSKSDLSALFTARDRGQTEDFAPIAANSIQASVALWSNRSRALVFATAAPATEAAPSSIGVLFLLARANDRWHIADYRQFSASGKEASVSAELTAGTRTGYHLGSEGMMPVVTVKECHGGRGYAYQLSGSYSFQGAKLNALELE